LVTERVSDDVDSVHAPSMQFLSLSAAIGAISVGLFLLSLPSLFYSALRA
jgi:hypothetical protein